MSVNQKLLFVLLMENGKHRIGALTLIVEVEYSILKSILQGLHFIKDSKFKKLKMILMILMQVKCQRQLNVK